MAPINSHFGMSERQFLTVVIFGVSNLFSATVVSIAAPFYPEEATLKGASTTEYGLVFGVFHFTLFLTSPIYGVLLGKISPTYLFNAGNLLLGTSCLAFGFLAYIDDHTAFITLSFILRILQAAGHSANAAASFTIITVEFPDSFATTFAALETCYGLGLIVGPTTGGVLYEVGGFVLPFFTMGILLVVTASVGTYFLIPVVIESTKNKDIDSEKLLGPDELPPNFNSAATAEKKFNFFSLIKIPGVALAGSGIAVSACSIGFLQATLEPFLKETFGVTPMITGFIFMIDGLMYTLAAPIWGRLCDKWVSNPKFITLAGCSCTFTGFLLIGPAPLLNKIFPPSLWLVCLGLCIHGLGMGASFVSAFIQGIQDSIAAGFPDSCATYGLVSGMWMSGLALGGCIGPSVGGFLLSYFSFSDSSVFVLVTQFIMGLSTVIFISLQNRSTTFSVRRPSSSSHRILDSSEEEINKSLPLLANQKS